MEDQSIWAWTSYLLTKYKIILWILAWFLIAAGFGFQTPAQTTNKLQKEIDELAVSRDTLMVRQTEIRRTLNDLKFLACLNHMDQAVCQPR